jgi:hypothetical protein
MDYYICTCDHPDTWYDPACHCCRKRPAVRPVGAAATSILRRLVSAIDDDPDGDLTPLWAEARQVLGEAS